MHLIARLLLALLGLGLLAGLLLALGAYVVFASLRWLLTGRKPQVVLVWQQLGALRRGQRAGTDRAAPDGHPNPDDVVDVEVREVREGTEAPNKTPRLPGGG